MPADKQVEPPSRPKRGSRASSADKSPPQAPRRSTRASSADKSPPPASSRRQSMALKKIVEETQGKPTTPTKAKNTQDDVPTAGTPKRRGRGSLNPTPAVLASPVRVTRRSVAALAEEIPAVVSSPRRKSRASVTPSVTASPARVTRNSLAVHPAEEETEAKPPSPPTRSRRKSMMPKGKLQAHDEDVSQAENPSSVEKIEGSPENRPSSATSEEVESITKPARPAADRTPETTNRSGRNTPSGSAVESSGRRTPETKIPTRSNRNTPTGSGEVRTPPHSQGGSRPSTPLTSSPRNIPDLRGSTKPSPDRQAENPSSVEKIEGSPENRPSSATSEEVESITKPARPGADRTPETTNRSGRNTPSGSPVESIGRRTPETKIPTRGNRNTPTGSGEVRTPPHSQGGSRPSTPVTSSPRNIPDLRGSTKPSPDRHVNCSSRDSSPIFMRDLRRNSFQSPVRCSPRSSPSRQPRLSFGESRDASPKSGTKPTSPLVTERSASPLHKNDSSSKSARVENAVTAKEISVPEKHSLDDEDDTLMMPNKRIKRDMTDKEAGPANAGPPPEQCLPKKKIDMTGGEAGPSADAGPPKERRSPRKKKSGGSPEQKVDKKLTIHTADSAGAMLESDVSGKSRSSPVQDPNIQESKISNEVTSSSDVQDNLAVPPSETAVDKLTPTEGSGSHDERPSGESVKDIASSVEAEGKVLSSEGDSHPETSPVSDAGHGGGSKGMTSNAVGNETLSSCEDVQDLELKVEGSDGDEYQGLEQTVINYSDESGSAKGENLIQGEVVVESTVSETNSDVSNVKTPVIPTSAKSPEKCESGEGKTPNVGDVVVANFCAEVSSSDVLDPETSATKPVVSPAKCERGMSDESEVAVAATAGSPAVRPSNTETPCVMLSSTVDRESGEPEPDEVAVCGICPPADQSCGDLSAETPAKDVASYKSGENETSGEAEAPASHKSAECNSCKDPKGETPAVEESSNMSSSELESGEGRTKDEAISDQLDEPSVKPQSVEVLVNPKSPVVDNNSDCTITEIPANELDVSPSNSKEGGKCDQDETMQEDPLSKRDGCDVPNAQTPAVKESSHTPDAPVESEIEKSAVDHILVDEGYSETSDSEYHSVGATDKDVKVPSILEGLKLKGANQEVSSVIVQAVPSPEKLRMGCDSSLEKISEDDETACEDPESKTAREDKLVLLKSESTDTTVRETPDPAVASPLKLAVSPEPCSEDDTMLKGETDSTPKSPSKIVERDTLNETDITTTLGKLGLKKYVTPSSKTERGEETVGAPVEQDCGTDIYESDTVVDSDEEKTRDAATEKIETVEECSVEIYENDTTSVSDSDEDGGPVKGSDFIDDEAEEGEETEESENDDFVYDETEGSDPDSDVELLDESCFIVDEAVEVGSSRKKTKDCSSDDENDPEVEESEKASDDFDESCFIVEDESRPKAKNTSKNDASESKARDELDAKNDPHGEQSEKSKKVVSFGESSYITGDETHSTSEDTSASAASKTQPLVDKPAFQVSRSSVFSTDAAVKKTKEFASVAASQFVASTKKGAKAESVFSTKKKSSASKKKSYASTAAAEFVVSETAAEPNHSKHEEPLKGASVSPQKSESSFTSSDAEQENAERAAKTKKRPAAEVETEALKEKKKFKKMENAQLFCMKLCNVAPRTTIEELKKALGQFGIATGLKRLEFCQRVEKHKKTALAAYDSKKNLEKALTGYGKVKVHDRTIFFLLDDETAPITEDTQFPASPKKSPRKKFVGIISELSNDITIGDIVAAYETEGIRFINKVKLYKLRSSKDDKNFAKLEFSKKTALLKAIIVTENIIIKGEKISLKIREKSSVS